MWDPCVSCLFFLYLLFSPLSLSSSSLLPDYPHPPTATSTIHHALRQGRRRELRPRGGAAAAQEHELLHPCAMARSAPAMPRSKGRRHQHRGEWVATRRAKELGPTPAAPWPRGSAAAPRSTCHCAPWPGAAATAGRELRHPVRPPRAEERGGRATSFRLAGDLAAGELPAPFLWRTRVSLKGLIAFSKNFQGPDCFFRKLIGVVCKCIKNIFLY